MADHDKARPVSGEIMTDGREFRPHTPVRDYTDAEFQSVESEPLLPRESAGTKPPTAPATGMDMLRSGQSATASSRGAQRGGPAFWISGMIIVFGAFWISGGHAVVRQMPAFQPVEQSAPLRLVDVRSRIENTGARGVLYVDGAVANQGNRAMPLPPLSISVSQNDGSTTRYFLGTTATVLEPGERYSFSSRLEAPRNGVKSVSVTFSSGDM